MSEADGRQGSGEPPGARDRRTPAPKRPTGGLAKTQRIAGDIGFENPPVPADAAAPLDPDKTPPPGALHALAPPFGTSPSPDREFDAVGFDAFQPVQNVDDDDTPSGGVFVGGEEVQVIDANALGRALAQAQGLPLDDEGPDLAVLRKGLIGIDLGAAIAVVARFNENGKHEIVPNVENELGTPAHVFYDEDGERLVGKEALRLAPSAPDRAFVEAKTLLADPKFEGAVQGAKVDAEELVSVLAKRLLEDVQKTSGEKPTHAALAAPVWFTPAQRDALGRAVAKAGIEVVGVADEPLAAAVPYSLRLEDLNPRVAAIFDLGHSGLGCAVVRCARGDIEILKADARRGLGATRWDEVIATEAAKHFKEQHGFDPREDKGAALDLRIRAEEAKKALSQRTSFTVVAQARGKTSKVSFARQAFEEASRKLVDEACAFFRSVRDAANVKSWAGVDAIIVTGGGTRMPMIRRAIKKETNVEPEKGTNPDEAVAIGALYWGLLARSRASKPPTTPPPKKR